MSYEDIPTSHDNPYQAEQVSSVEHLYAPVDLEQSATLHASRELAAMPRYQTLFAPSAVELSPDESGADDPEDRFDHLFIEDDEEYERQSAKRVAEYIAQSAQRPVEQDWKASDATRRASAFQLTDTLAGDAVFEGLLDKHFGRTRSASFEDKIAVVDAIRTNPGLRLEVGAYFLAKERAMIKAHPHSAPRRVFVNAQKNPRRGTLPLPDTTSQEYVALLCLAKLDGTFDDVASKSFPIELDERRVASEGQHRFMADAVLSSEEI